MKTFALFCFLATSLCAPNIDDLYPSSITHPVSLDIQESTLSNSVLNKDAANNSEIFGDLFSHKQSDWLIYARCSGCGCRGGPGWRSKRTGKCVGWKRFKKVCGNPPSSKLCTKEN